MVPERFDQVTEEMSSEAASDRSDGERGKERESPRRGVRSEVWRVKPKADGVQ